MSAVNGLGDLFAVVLAASKDKAYIETVEKMQAAFHELILAEAESRRDKTETLIREMSKIDREMIRFKREYNRIRTQLAPETIIAIDNYLKSIEQKKKELCYKKDMLKNRR